MFFSQVNLKTIKMKKEILKVFSCKINIIKRKISYTIYMSFNV